MSERVVKPAGIILAAGQSSRFGADKLLHELTIAGKSRSLIQHTVLSWLSVFDEINVVVQLDSPCLQYSIQTLEIADNKQIKLVPCRDADLGMAHSLRAGIKATDNAEGWIIGLADMPLIPTSVLSQAYHNIRLGASITAPFFKGRRGHPVGLSRCYRDELLALRGDTGAKSLLQREVENIVEIEAEHQGVLADIDELKDVHVIEHLG